MPDKTKGVKKYENILVPVRHPHDVNRIAELAEALIDRGKITFLTVVEKGGFSEMQRAWRKSSRIIENYEDRVTSRRVMIEPKIRYSESVWKGIIEQAEEDDVDLILMGWGKKITFRSLRQTPVERVLSNSDRDVLVFQSGGGNIQDMGKILLPIAYEDYDYSKRLTIISKLTESMGAECTLMHVLQEGTTEEEVEAIFEGPRKFMKERGIECETAIIEHNDVSEALIEESKKYDLIVLGPTKEYVFSRYMFGWLTDEIVNNAQCSSIVFKEAEVPWKAWIKGAISGLCKEFSNVFK